MSIEKLCVEFTHAIHQDENGQPVKVSIFPLQVFGVHYLPATKSTAILAHGGAYTPVLESVDEVLKAIKKVKADDRN